MSVSKSWKRLLESSHKLWTTFDTTQATRKVSQPALRAYLRRSNYTVDEAIVKSAAVDAAKLQYLTRTCTKLQRLTICGSFLIGESLTSALPLAKSLQSLKISPQITMGSVVEALRHVQATIVDAEFEHVLYGGQSQFTWPRLETLRVLRVSRGRDQDIILVRTST